VQILRLPWLADDVEGHFRVADPDLLARLAENDPRESMEALAENLIPAALPGESWTARLASELPTASRSLRSWAEELGMRPEALSRGFHRDFGTAPKQFRLQARARKAWQQVLSSTRSLTTIAYDFGFSDLAHLSRSIRCLTGHPPSYWRSRTRNCVQA
jgi:AraC-like DNA-binding protein